MRVSHPIHIRIVQGGLIAALACWGPSVSAQPPKPTPKPPQKAAPKPPPKAPVNAPPKVEPKVEPAPPPPEDLVVTMRYVGGDKTTTSTVSMKGRHQRIDYGADLAVLRQCGGDQMIQVNDQNKKFLTVENPHAAPDPGEKSKKGGTITYTTTVTDTGERKALFGLTARHVKTVLTKTTTPNACDKRKERVETDGWFIDPPSQVCPAATRPAVVTSADDCRDTVEYVDPSGPAVGYPLAYTATTTDDEGKVSTMSMEVTGFTRSTLADSLFAVPQGYAEVPNLMQLNALPNGAKRPGIVRTCAASVLAKSDYQGSLDDLSEAFVVSLGDAGLDAVRVSARTAADAAAEVKAHECDYVLTTEITDVRKPGKGVLGRISGTTQGYGAKVDFKMTAPGSKTAQLTSSERSGGSTLKVAIGAAKTVSRYVTPFGLLGSSFGSMSNFAALGGNTSAPAMEQSSDPVMNTVFQLVDRATGNKPEPDLQSEEAAVAAAMEQEVKAVAAFVLKKPK
jgi:hypothetical protein